MRGRWRSPSALELALWRHMVHDVRPLEPPLDGGQPPAPPAVASPADAPVPIPTPAPAPTKPQQARPPVPAAPDRRLLHKLQRGHWPIAARLDLHGLTQAEAHGRLTGFVDAQHAKGARCVLVITGRGLRSGGVLKAETPRWLAAPPLAEKVLTWAHARTGQGGEGALYVLLRRPR